MDSTTSPALAPPAKRYPPASGPSTAPKRPHATVAPDPRPRTVTPNDNLIAWFRPVGVTADNPFSGMNKLVANNPYDSWRTDNVVAGDLRGITQSSTVNYNAYVSVPPNAQQPYWLIDGATNQLLRVEGGWINVGARNNDGSLRGAGDDKPGDRYAQNH